MKKITFLGFAIALASATILTSCNKYEEGSNFSLISKKNRVVNDWSLSTVEDSNGTSVDLSGITTTASIKKDGSYTTTSSFSILGQTITDTENGTWSFTDDKTGLTFTDDATSTASTSTIVKLTNGELKLRDEETKYVSTFVGK